MFKTWLEKMDCICSQSDENMENCSHGKKMFYICDEPSLGIQCSVFGEAQTMPILTLVQVPIHVFCLFHAGLYLLAVLCSFSQVILYGSSVFLNFKWTTHEKRPIFTSHKTCSSPPLYSGQPSAYRISMKVQNLLPCLAEQAHNKFVSPLEIGKEQTRTVLSTTFFSQTSISVSFAILADSTRWWERISSRNSQFFC